MADNKKGWRQGLFVPHNPEKYRGDVNKITFRSSWELNFAKFLDGNHHVLEWASEEFAIPYYNPIKKRMAKYYPDFWVHYRDKDDVECVEVIEIKPYNQVQRPKNGTKQQQATWVQNMAKWDAAVKYCAGKRIKFRVLTENKLYKAKN